MNLKERGVTVGDILLFLIVIFSIVIISKNINKDKETSLNLNNQTSIYLKAS